GVAPGVGPDSYLQPVELRTPTAAAPPKLTVGSGATQVSFEQGRDIAAMEPPPLVEGALVRLTEARVAPETVSGKIVVYDSPIYDAPGVQALIKAGAVAVV